MNNLPPLGPLISFRAAAKHESFTKAAHELSLTHGAVSRAVKQLEEFFGQPLFHRRNRRLFLTRKGRFFADRVEKILSELETTCEQLLSVESRRRLSVSCEPSLTMRWLMPRLDKFHNMHPEIEVHLSTEGGPIDLSAKGVHLAIRRSDFTWPDSYHCIPLVKEKIGPVCSPGYWGKLQEKGHRLLHTRTRPSAWTDWKELGGYVPEAVSEQYFDHFYFSLQGAVAGLGMAIGSEPMFTDDVRQGLLVAPYGLIETSVEYVALTLQNTTDDHPLHCFIPWLKEELYTS